MSFGDDLLCIEVESVADHHLTVDVSCSGPVSSVKCGNNLEVFMGSHVVLEETDEQGVDKWRDGNRMSQMSQLQR